MQHIMNLATVRRILDTALTDRAAGTRERLQTERRSDANDDAQWSEDAAVALGELDIAWGRKQQARAALERLKAGRYGECETCGRAIGEARLAALPWAIQCVRCAEVRERRGGSTAQSTGQMADWLDKVPDAA